MICLGSIRTVDPVQMADTPIHVGLFSRLDDASTLRSLQTMELESRIAGEADCSHLICGQNQTRNRPDRPVTNISIAQARVRGSIEGPPLLGMKISS